MCTKFVMLKVTHISATVMEAGLKPIGPITNVVVVVVVCKFILPGYGVLDQI